MSIIDSFNAARQQNCVRPGPQTKTQLKKQAVKRMYYAQHVRCIGDCVMCRCYTLDSSYQAESVWLFYQFTLQFEHLFFWIDGSHRLD